MYTQGPHNRPRPTENPLPLQERIQHRFAQARKATADAPAETRPSQAAGRVSAVGELISLSGTSPVRAEKVIQARQRIAEGYYGKPEITEALSRALFETMGLDDD